MFDLNDRILYLKDMQKGILNKMGRIVGINQYLISVLWPGASRIIHYRYNVANKHFVKVL